MTRALVTGAAGFIGSVLTDALLAEGYDVVGLDAFTPYYSRARKESNLTSARANGRFRLIEADLRADDLSGALEGVDVVFHQAGQPGVRLSWATGFADYDSHNIAGTQRLLEAVRERGAGIARVVIASSSSVYGNAGSYPTRETDLPRPHSPYGVTKLAAEHLGLAYCENWQVPVVVLRYFTVYGPRQRPDMAMQRIIEAGTSGEPFPLYGDGSAIRDFTYVDDVVRANLLAAVAEPASVVGHTMNIAGGASISVAELLDLAGELLGTAVPVDRRAAEPGDVDRTGGAIDRAAELLGWHPQVGVRQGLAEQITWARSTS